MKSIARSVFVLLLALASAPSAFSASAADSWPDLTGRVTRADGAPVPKATVFIYTAGPKVGTGSLCPSCYPDCRKKAQTDAEGRFKIEALDPKLVFRLLTVAGGYEAKFVPKVDPSIGPADMQMVPLDRAALTSKSRIAGVVFDPEGEPLVGAVISPEGVGRGNSTRWGANDDVVDPVAVADDRGRFLLRCQEEVTSVHAIAEARGAAKRWVTLTPGSDHVIRMEEGVTITGRLMRQGRALKDVAVGLITTERQCGICLHDFETATDKDGWFVLSNVTPDNSYYLFAKMDSLREQGALPLRTIDARASGTTVKLGELELGPAHRVAGRVVLSDGKPVPPDTRLFLGREQAWDHTELVLDSDGRFEFLGLPTESVSLSGRIKGYRFSKKNPSLDWLNGGIVGHVDQDISDLILLMEPGERLTGRNEDPDMPADSDRQPRAKALRGAKL